MTTRTLAMPSAFMDHYRRNAPVMRLYMTVCKTDFTLASNEVETKPRRYVFSGRPDGFFVKRFSGKGGRCAATDCVEVK